ncbi:MAG: hypothetical protein KatS3mg023_2669 [Armatimonadota bacterium]|nr:MAG: hypothetical protein KatS3mg023_2669 [Armatimonadota bacterium]
MTFTVAKQKGSISEILRFALYGAIRDVCVRKHFMVAAGHKPLQVRVGRDHAYGAPSGAPYDDENEKRRLLVFCRDPDRSDSAAGCSIGHCTDTRTVSRGEVADIIAAREGFLARSLEAVPLPQVVGNSHLHARPLGVSVCEQEVCSLQVVNQPSILAYNLSARRVRGSRGCSKNR